jgi:cyanate permease
MRRVLVAVSAVFFFVSATTFQAMGIPLFAMAGELGWSEAAAGGAFMALGLACAATSLLPVVLLPRIGGRWTIVLGCLVLAAGFALAWLGRGLPMFYLAAGLFGLAFSLVANTSGIWLIGGWYGAGAARLIGLYLMSGTLGGAAGPPLAEVLIAAGGWRFYWLVMAALALVLAALCAMLIGEPPSSAPTAESVSASAALRTPQFLVVALAMVATQTCLITVSSVVAPHFARLGLSADFAAALLGFQALVGTAATGISGWLTGHVAPKRLLALGVLAQGAGLVLLVFASAPGVPYGFTIVFGVGWSTASLAVTVLLFRYFGNDAGAAALSTIWLLSGIAAFGPSAAGFAADLSGSFAPALLALAALQLPIALAAALLSPPRRVAAALSARLMSCP